MITISENTYREVATQLQKACEGKTFFNGNIEYDTEEFYSTLTCTLILCRDPDTNHLLSALPVWWEYHLYQPQGEVLTDFSWNELCRIMEQ